MARPTPRRAPRSAIAYRARRRPPRRGDAPVARGCRGTAPTGSAAARRPRDAANRAAGRATSSLATTAIVASGLPSSCAAAAASAPTAETRCSRARASWVAATASRSRRASAATLHVYPLIKIVAITSAVHRPRTNSAGKYSGACRQGSGMCHKARTLIIAIANAASAITGRSDSAVAATVTGARIRIENGFSSPPVRNRSSPSCNRS